MKGGNGLQPLQTGKPAGGKTWQTARKVMLA